MKNLIIVLLYIWQLPQNIVALLYRYVFMGKNRGEETRQNVKGRNIRVVYKSTCDGSVSLGSHIFISNCVGWKKDLTIAHELGHTVQSLYLGPLYLIVVGIPSILWASIRRLGFFGKTSYYAFYTEKWADRIAGITR